MKRRLKKFDPVAVADFELKMWQSYYSHNFIRLFFNLIRFFQELFDFNFVRAVVPAFHAAYAATIFRRNKGRENAKTKKRMLVALVNFYRIVSENSVESFDYKQVAELELEWWFVDRYPEKYSKKREDAMADVMAAIFNVDKEKCVEYANHRAKAMVLQDKFEHGDIDTIDWPGIETLLHKSYKSLHTAVQ